MFQHTQPAQCKSAKLVPKPRFYHHSNLGPSDVRQIGAVFLSNVLSPLSATGSAEKSASRTCSGTNVVCPAAYGHKAGAEGSSSGWLICSLCLNSMSKMWQAPRKLQIFGCCGSQPRLRVDRYHEIHWCALSVWRGRQRVLKFGSAFPCPAQHTQWLPSRDCRCQNLDLGK